MKEIIIVFGNMGSGKTTFAKALNKQFTDYKYICLDDQRKVNFDDVLGDDNNSFEFEKKVKRETETLFGQYDRIIYETTGGTEFFRLMYADFLKKGYQLLTVKIDCNLELCLYRHEKRERKGHFHVVPKYKKALSPYEAIRRFEEKSAWIKPDMVLDSVNSSQDEMVSQFLLRYSKSDKDVELKKLIAEFEYLKALAWYNKHVEGKFFIKELLAKGEDEYNRGKLKAELHKALEAIQSVSEQPTTPITPEERTPHKNNISHRIVENAASSPEEQNLKEEWRPKYALANQLFAQLDMVQDDEERKLRCFEILELMDEVEKIWQKGDFLKKYGTLPQFDKAGADQLTTNQAATRIRTLRTYVSKAKKGILKEDKIPEWQAEILELERITR